MHLKRGTILILCLFLFVFSSYASYTISGYKFDINGKTKDFVLRNLIVPKTVETFKTEDELKTALEKKKQILINTQLFYEDKIEYSYEKENSGAGDYSVFVDYRVTDSHSSIIFPYPKYDSNKGLVLGLRFKEKNFLGTYKPMSIIFDTQQFENSYKEGNFYLEVPFEGIRLKEVEFSGTFKAKLDLHDKADDYVSFSLKENNLKIGNIRLDSKAVVDYNYYKKNFSEIGGGIFVSGTLFDDGFSIKAGGEIDIDNEDVTDSFSEAYFELDDIYIGQTSISNRAYAKFTNRNTQKFEFLEAYKLEDIFRWNLGPRFSFGAKGSLYPDYSIYGDYADGEADISYKLSDKVTASLLLGGEWYQSRGRVSLSPGERLSFNFKIKNEVPVSISIGEHNKYIFSTKSWKPYFSTSINSVYGTINYVGNFRKGIRYNIAGEAKYSPWETETVDKSSYKFKINLTTFPFALSWFNPSFRVTLVASSKQYYWTDDSSWRMDEDDIQSLLRGVLENNDYVERAYLNSNVIATLNSNLAFKFIEFEDFGKTYLNLFVDAGILRRHENTMDTKNNREYKILGGAGIELMAILDSHPAYPFRISVGFDIESLYDKIVEKNEDAELKPEIFVGLGWFF